MQGGRKLKSQLDSDGRFIYTRPMRYSAVRLLWPVLLGCLYCAPAGGKEYWNYKTAYEAYDAGEYVLAADIYKRLAKSGDARAQNDLGFLYFVGQGVTQNARTAATWFHKSAEQGHAPALLHLADLYASGQGVERSAVEAHKYYNLASLIFRDAEQKHLASGRRDAIASGMTAEQLANAQTRACQWWRTHMKMVENGLGSAPPALRRCVAE